MALPLGPGVFRPGFLAQSVQHGLHRFGAAGSQVAVESPGAAQGGLEPELPVLEPVIPVTVGLGEAAPHLLGQPGQVGQFGAAGRGGEQDLVGVVAGVLGQLVGPVADLPRPRRGDPAVGQRVGDGGVGAEPPHPPDRADAAPPVTWVCHRSQVRGDLCPSSSYPAAASNADSTDARAAVCTDATRSSSRRQSACTATGADATSARASQPSASTAVRTASASGPRLSLETAPRAGPHAPTLTAAPEGAAGLLIRTAHRNHLHSERANGPDFPKMMTNRTRLARTQCTASAPNRPSANTKKMEGHSTENDLPARTGSPSISRTEQPLPGSRRCHLSQLVPPC